MDFKLELIVVPVSDVDRAKHFYADEMGFNVDVDTGSSPNFRVVQLTPRGSACSITIGTGLTQTEPGTYKGLHLIVTDIEAARLELTGRGVEMSEPFHFSSAGERGEGLHPERANYGTFCQLDDPDGNTWLIQEARHQAR